MSNRSRALLIWILVSFLMVLHFFLMLSVGVITTQVRTSLHLTAFELSILSSAYLYIYILLQTPVGVLLDIYGERKLLTIGSFISCFACWLFAYSGSFYVSVIARILMGGGLSFVFVAAIQLAAKWFHLRYLGLMIGLAETAGVLGAIVGNVTLAFFVDKLGWRNSFYLAALVSFVLACLTWIWMRDRPHGSLLDLDKKPNLYSVYKNLRIIIREPDIWLHSGYMSLIYVAVTVFSGLWANPFLRNAFGFSLAQATISCSILLMGFGIGSPIVGILCAKDKARMNCMIYSAVAMLIFLCWLIYVPGLSLLTVNLLMFGIGIACSASILSFAIISDTAPVAVKSTSIGFVNTLSLVSAIFFQPIIGWILNILSDHVSDAGIEVYSAGQYRIALSVLPVLILIALALSLMIAKRYARSNNPSRKHT